MKLSVTEVREELSIQKFAENVMIEFSGAFPLKNFADKRQEEIFREVLEEDPTFGLLYEITDTHVQMTQLGLEKWFEFSLAQDKEKMPKVLWEELADAHDLNRPFIKMSNIMFECEVEEILARMQLIRGLSIVDNQQILANAANSDFEGFPLGHIGRFFASKAASILESYEWI